jgi:hypothetical protein
MAGGARYPAGARLRASQRGKRPPAAPSPLPAFLPGQRVRWGHYEGEVISITGDTAEVLCGAVRWRLPVASLARC